MRTRTKLLSLVITLLLLGIIAAPASAQQMSVQFIIRDENNQPMTGVTVYIYTTTGDIPPTPGPLYKEILIDSGDSYSLPYGKYLCEPTKAGYVSRFATEDNRITEGQTVSYLYMDKESGGDPETGWPVTLRAVDESSILIPGTTFKIYRCTSSAPYSPIELVKTEYSASGQLYITDLPKDYYCVEVSKTGYTQKYSTEDNRFRNHEYSVTLNVFMDTETPTPLPIGSVVVWGHDGSGQVSGMPSGLKATKIVAGTGGWHNLALTPEGDVVAWGSDVRGQVSGVPDGLKATDIAAGEGHSLAIDMEGNVVAWGQYLWGLVSGDWKDPAEVVPAGIKATKIACGWHHDLAITPEGDVVAWGYDGFSMVSGIPPGLKATAIAAGKTYSLAIDMEGNVVAWGDGDYTNVPDGLKATAIAAGWGHSLAIDMEGNVVAWGYDGYGQVSGMPSGLKATKIACGEYFSLAVTPEGHIVIWGRDNYDQISDIPIVPDLIDIDAGAKHGIAFYVDESGEPEPNENVEFRPYDINGHSPLNGVEITLYTCDPVTFEPGNVVDNFIVDYGDVKSLPRGYYCIEASYGDYNQVHTISETRFSNVDRYAIAVIPMEFVGEGDPGEGDAGVEVRIVDMVTEDPLQNVRIRIYEALTDFEQGRLVKDVVVNSGDKIYLPAGQYFAQATKSGYTQYFDVTDTRLLVDPLAHRILYIPMVAEGQEAPGTEVRIVDMVTDAPLQNVRLRIYEALPNFEQGPLVKDVIVNSGDKIYLPAGQYFGQATKSGYTQYFDVLDTRLLVDPLAHRILYIPMVAEGDANVEVRVVDMDTEEPLQNVRLRIYEALPNFEQGPLVKEVTVNSGDHIYLPAGRYFGQATKSGYNQYFDVTNTRVVVDPPYSSILYIPMTSRDGITPGGGSFLDQSIEGIANLFGVSFGIGKTILGMLLALGIGTATAKHLRGGAQEFGVGMLGGVVLGVLIGLLPIWVLVLLVLIVGLWIGYRYMGGSDS